MTKYEFDRELKRGIKGLPEVEVKKALDYYTELFEDKIEQGKCESAIIAEFGNPTEIGAKLVGEFGGAHAKVSKSSKQQVVEGEYRIQNHVSGGRLAVLIVLAVLFGAALIGVGAGIWATIVGLFAGGAACVIAGGVAVIPSIFAQIANPAVMWVQIGVCVMSVGIGILLIIFTIKLAKLCVYLTKKMFGFFKKWLVVKRLVAE